MKTKTTPKKYPRTVSLDGYFEKRLGTQMYLKTKKEAHREAEILKILGKEASEFLKIKKS
jgi:hypothetical protein